MDEYRRHVDEFRSNLYIEVLHIFDILEVLRGDLCDRDVVDVDILLADQIEQQVQWTVIDLADSDRERELALVFAGDRA